MSLEESISYLNKLYGSSESFVSIANEYLLEHNDSYESFINNHRNYLNTIFQELIISNEDKLIRRGNCFIDEISLRVEVYSFAINGEIAFWKEKKYKDLSIDHFILDNPRADLFEKILHNKGEIGILDKIRDKQIHQNKNALTLLLFLKYEFIDFKRKLALTFQDIPDFKLDSQKTSFRSKSSKKSNSKEKNIDNKDRRSINLIWNNSDTDLMELTTALFLTKSINNPNGDLTRKDLLMTLCKIFGKEIKDAESKLSKATLRNDPTKFLDELKNNFENYIDSKFA